MSLQQFVETAVLPSTVNVQVPAKGEYLRLNERQRHDINKFIEERAKDRIDYHYQGRDTALARTAIADLKAIEKWGIAGSVVGFYVFQRFLKRHTNLYSIPATARYARLGCLFAASFGYYAVTQASFDKYSKISSRLNTRVSDEFSKMMDLKKA
jgi:hypothetical protein